VPAFPDFARRATEPERMDVEALDDAELAACLADLEQVNRVTRATAPTLAFIDQLTRGWPAGSELRVLDVGVGQGGMLRAIHRYAGRRGLKPRLTGIDCNPQCLAAARAATPADMAIDWVEGDAMALAPAEPPHAIVTSLFMHHLSDPDLVTFLRWQEATASDGWFVNDLHRHWLAWSGFSLLARVAGWHQVVREDGALSVRRAFVKADWDRLLQEAAVGAARIRWHLPFRLCVSRLKTAPDRRGAG
jgi:2-polyprenyl-3-methyl-5-hydroxy-6-metoxy-1,4-benzoquinol methylase